MSLKKHVRFQVCSLLAVLSLSSQSALCLPFLDTAAYAPVAAPYYTNLSGLLNPEGAAWAPLGTNQTVDVWAANTNYMTNFGGIPPMIVQAQALTYPGLECSDSNVFLFGTVSGSGYSERIPIQPPISGTNPFVMTTGTIYYSFVFSISSLGGLTTGGFISGFNTLTGPQGTQPTVIGSRIYFKTSGTGYQIGIGKNPAAPANATFLPAVFAVGATNFVVCSYTFVNGGTSNDVASMWLNPAPANLGAVTPPTPDAVNNSGPDLQSGGANQLESFLFRQGNSQVPSMNVCDLRLGYCWACVTPPAVTPPPQAATLSITSLSANTNIVSFATNSPCFKLVTSTNLTVPFSNWNIISTSGDLAGTNFAITNTLAGTTTVSSNVVGGVTNFSTNTSYPNTFYQAKSYNN